MNSKFKKKLQKENLPKKDKSKINLPKYNWPNIIGNENCRERDTRDRSTDPNAEFQLPCNGTLYSNRPPKSHVLLYGARALSLPYAVLGPQA
jgi:hypothetical protein